LTTEGAVLSSVREGADLDFHVIVPRDGSWAEPKLHNFIMDNLLDRFSDVVKVEDVMGLV
jgi:nicotinamidase-related amidase